MINWHSLPSSLHYYSLQLQVSYINNYFNLWILFSAGSSRLKHLGVRTVFINTWQLTDRQRERGQQADRGSDRQADRHQDEAVTSFVGDDDEDAAVRQELERRVSDTEIREKIEDSMSDKIRDWRNMTAESVTGQVDEWQSLGNFNVPQQANKRPVQDDIVDEDLPVEKRRSNKPLKQCE